jgi:predicted Rossmann fold flavoprotein
MIAGAGPAGLVAGWFAARGGASSVEILERNEEAGVKLCLTGGGRCNILPADIREGAFRTGSSRNTLNRILRSWTVRAARDFVEQAAGIELSPEEGTGKLFPVSNSAVRVREALLALVLDAGARIRPGFRLDSLMKLDGGGWEARGGDGGSACADRIILATGGCSWPQTGSDGLGFRLARSLGHRVRTVSPALVPLVSGDPRWTDLAGITVGVTIRTPDGRPVSDGNLLVTHGTFSGPAVLDASHAWGKGLRIQWCGLDAPAWSKALQAGRGRVLSLVRREIPERLAIFLLGEAGLGRDAEFADLSREKRMRLVEMLAACPLPVSGSGGWAKAEVTSGGVALEDLRSDTLESRIVPGLFMAGEMLDAFGPIGGYNLYWAFLTGRLAGMGAAR